MYDFSKLNQNSDMNPGPFFLRPELCNNGQDPNTVGNVCEYLRIIKYA